MNSSAPGPLTLDDDDADDGDDDDGADAPAFAGARTDLRSEEGTTVEDMVRSLAAQDDGDRLLNAIMSAGSGAAGGGGGADAADSSGTEGKTDL